MNPNPRVICIGEILWDCLADQPTDSIAAVTSWTRYPGGAPANVACGLAQLGVPTAFVGCIGGDDWGEKLLEPLRSRTINTAGIQRYLRATTRQVQVLRTPTGERQFVGFLGDPDLPPDATPDFADTHLQAHFLPTELFAAAEFLVTGTLGLANPETRKAIEESLNLADRHYLKVLMDINWRPMFWSEPETAKPTIHQILPRVDFLKLSEEEAQWLFDTTDPRTIAHLNDHEGVLITRGAEGCAYCLSENEGILPAFDVEVEDTTGAGDAFLAGFLAQLCQRGLSALNNPDTAREIVTYASAVGAIVTTDAGAIAPQPTAQEVEAFFYLNKIRE
jgi:fructokinase